MKLKQAIDQAPDYFAAKELYEKSRYFEAVDTTYAYMMATSNLDAMMKQDEAAKDEPLQKTRHKNLEEVARFVKDGTDLSNTFM